VGSAEDKAQGTRPGYLQDQGRGAGEKKQDKNQCVNQGNAPSVAVGEVKKALFSTDFNFLSDKRDR
jgi:hypothetical protein